MSTKKKNGQIQPSAPETDNNQTAKTQRLNLIAIGASAGGLEALQDFLANFPAIENACIIVAQHLSPTHKSMLVQLLSRETELEVVEAVHLTELGPNKIYITPPDKEITVLKGQIILSKPYAATGPKPSVDVLFHSLAKETDFNVTGIILSGTGSDGSSGIKRIKESGGLTIVQDPSTAKYDGMPLASIETGKVDLILPPNQIGSAIKAYLENPRQHPAPPEDLSHLGSGLEKIFSMLSRHTGTDFSNYKSATLQRRLAKRLAILNLETIEEYIPVLEKNPRELDEMFNMILIGVTTFFRDTDAFKALEKLLQEMLQSKSSQEAIRVWVPGCSTGEEAYSIAILLSELLKDHTNQFSIQIFATDIDEKALAKARKGIYSEASLEQVPKSLISQYFTKTGNNYELSKAVRSLVLFSKHDLTSNPPFLKLDLISCRNLLIYFNASLQQQIIPIFHYALRQGGYLFLGKSESVGHFSDLFAAIDARNKVFQRKRGGNLHGFRFPAFKPHQQAPTPSAATLQAKRSFTISDLVKETLFNTFEHPYVVINEVYDIQEVNGDVRLFMTLPQGSIQANLLKMVNPELQIEVRSIVTKSVKQRELVRSSIKKFNLFGNTFYTRIIAKPLIYQDANDELFIVIFEQLDLEEFITRGIINSEEDWVNLRIQELEHELAATQEHLQTYIEELETSNEEMQSLNEELQSTNEELQSANEELETSNEELQSSNEEIQITYNELKAVNEELERKEKLIKQNEGNLNALLNNNLQGFILLDETYKILTFNNQASDIFLSLRNKKIRKDDTFIGLLAPGQIEDFIHDFGEVLKGGTYQGEKALTDAAGHERWFSLNYSPVIIEDDAVKGISIGILDITSLKKALSDLNITERLLSSVFNATSIGICITDEKGRFVDANESYCKIYGYTKEELKGQNFTMMVPPQHREAVQNQHDEFIREGCDLPSEWEVLRKDGTSMSVFVSTELLVRPDGKRLAITSVRDVTQERQISKDLQASNFKYKAIVENSMNGIFLTKPDGTILEANQAACDIFGYTEEEFREIGRQGIVDPNSPNLERKLKERQVEKKSKGELTGIRKNGEKFPFEFSSVLFLNDQGEEVTTTIVNDISERKKAEHDMALLMHNTEESFILLDRNLDILAFNKQFEQNYKTFLGIDIQKGDNIINYAQPDRKEVVRQIYERVLAGHHEESEITITLSDQTTKTFIIKYKPAKDEYDNVIGVFVTSIDITERKKSREQLIANEKRFRSLVENAADAFIIFNTDAKPTYASPSIKQVLGYDEEETLSLNIFELIHPEDIAAVKEKMKDCLNKPGVPIKGYLARTKHKDGSWRWIEATTTNMLHDPAIGGIVDNFRDVTEEKLQQEELIRVKTNQEGLINGTQDLIWSIDTRMNLIALNDAYLEMMKIATQKTLKEGDPVIVEEFGEELVSKWKGYYKRVLSGEKFSIKENVYSPLKQRMSYGLISFSPILSAEGEVTGAACYSKDITEEVVHQIALKDAKAELENILDQSLDIVCTIDANGNFVKVSAAAERIWGYKPKELSGKPYISFVYEDDHDKTLKAAADIEAGVDMTNFENRYIRKDGSLIPITWSARWDKQEEIMYCIARDATEKKEAEALLELSEKRFKSLVQDGSDLIGILDMEANYIYVSPTSIAVLDIQPEEFIGKNAFDFIHPEDKDTVFANFSRLETEKRIDISPFRFKHNDGSWRWIETVVTNMVDEPAINGIVANSRDVTARIMAEKELRNSEEKYKFLFEANPLPKLIYDFKTLEILDVNETAIHHYGFSKNEFLEMHVHDLSAEKDSVRLFKSLANPELRPGTVNFGVSSLTTKNGDIISAELFGHRFEQNGQDCMILVCNDVTEREIALQKLKENQEKLLAAQKVAKLGYWQLHLKDNTLYWSDEVFEIWGSSPSPSSEVIFDTFYNSIHPDDREAFSHEHELSLAGKKEHDFEHRIILPDGSVKWVHEKGSLKRDKNGDPVTFEGTVQDITPQKMLSLSLKESNERFEYATKATFDAIWDWDLKKGTLYWGENFEVLFGHQLKNCKKGLSLLYDFIHEDDRARVFDSIHDALQNGDVHWKEQYQYKKGDGSYAYVMNKGIILRDEHNQVYRMVGAMQDVTRQKKEEHRLKLLESVITNTTDAVLITEAEPFEEPGPRIVYVNEAFTKMTGYSAEEVIGKSPRILQGPKSDRNELDRLGKALKNWESCEITTINYKKNGEEFWINFTVNPVADEKGWFTHWIAIERDVTVKKNQELQKQLLTEISQIFNEPFDLKTSLLHVLKHICYQRDFMVAEVWLISADRQRILLTASYAESEEGKRFLELSSNLTHFNKNEGLPGRTWKSETMQIWHVDMKDKTFARHKAAQKVSLRTVYGIPLFYNAEITGVLMLGSQEESIPSLTFNTLSDNFSHQFGAEIKRKQLEQELKEIFNLAPDVICIISTDGFFKQINPALCKLLEYTDEELLTTPFIELVHEDDKNKTAEQVDILCKGGTTSYFENRYITKSGKTLWLAWTATPSEEEGLLYGVAKDITEKKALEELLDKTTELARIGAWEVDLVKNEIYWSPMTREIHEVDESYEPNLESAIDFYVPEHREVVQKSLQQIIEHGKTFDFELRIITAKGNERWVRAIGRGEFVEQKCVRLLGSFQDIHDKKLVEQALETSNKSLTDYKLALDEASNVVITDAEGVILYVNENTCKLSGYSREELIGSHTRINNSNYHPISFFEDLWSAISAGEVWRGEIKNQSKDGSFYWVDTTIVPFVDEKGKPFQYLAIRFDITDKKMTEKAVIKALEDKNTILESIGDGFFAVDKEWTVTYWNNAAERMLFMKRDDILGKNLWDVYDDAIPTGFYDNYHKALEENTAVHFEEYYEALDIWFGVSAYPSPGGLSIYFKDVTHKKQIEERIRQSNERFERVAEATNDAIWDWDIEKNVLYFGEGFSTLFGHNISKNNPSLDFWKHHLHPEDIDRIMNSLNESLENSESKAWQGEYRYLKSDGSYAYVVDKGAIIRNQAGKAIRMVGAMHDITHHKLYEESLKQLNADLEKSIRELAISNQELEQFAYVASHDLQEPLRMVTSFLSRLEKRYGDMIDEKGKKYIHFAVDGTKRMRQIILDLLEFSRVGRMEESREEVDLDELIREILSLYQKQIEEKNATIEFGGLPKLVAFRTPLRQVFQNLISNSLKYHRIEFPPVIQIACTETPEHWQFSVQDNGIGIDAEYFDKIFIIFQRLHNKDEYSGTGIGLAITKKIIENQGGNIWLESTEGEGTCFYFTIPKQDNLEEKRNNFS